MKISEKRLEKPHGHDNIPTPDGDYTGEFAKFCRTVDPTVRLHNSPSRSIVFQDAVQNLQRSTIGKPTGLWYSCGDAWMQWCISENFGFAPFVHRVNIDFSKIKQIENLEQFDAFAAEYGMSEDDFYFKAFGQRLGLELSFGRYAFPYRPATAHIDWVRVAEDYAGIEINPYLWERRLDFNYRWYYGWDCASGCLWNNQAVLSVELVAYYDDGRIFRV